MSTDAGDRGPALTGTWVRSFEEDRDGVLVLRPPGYAFAPARAPRPALRLEDDGTVAVLRAGPGDRPEVQPGGGHWSVADSTLSLRSPTLSGDFLIEALEPDRLVLSRRPDSAA